MTTKRAQKEPVTIESLRASYEQKRPAIVARLAEFRQIFDAVAGASDQLTELLGSERKWHERTWAKRQSAYNDIAQKTSAIDGRIRAIVEREKTDP